MAESLILFPLDMVKNVAAVTVGVDGSKSVIKLKEIVSAKVLGFHLQI